jgi:Zn-dependent protease with chaperone function
MIDSQRKFDSLIRRLEGYAKHSPRGYSFGVACLAALGYAYIFVILAFMMAAIGALIYFVYWTVLHLRHPSAGPADFARLILPVLLATLAVIAGIVHTFRVEAPAPEGPELRREIAPRLYAMLEEISAELKAPRFDRVLLTDEFNASVVQTPRFGLIGRNENYLILGLPLLQALPPDQFRAVIAHELAHISGNHSRFAGWIYRLRKMWFQLLENLDGNWLFLPFFLWYAPYFYAYTFVLARANEYEADRCGAKLAGKEVMAEALVRTSVSGRFLGEAFWPSIYKRADHERQPSVRPYSMMFRDGEQRAALASGAAGWMRQAWESKTDTTDTHPALRDRLAALGFRGVAAGPLDGARPPLPAPEPVAESAAQRYLAGVEERFAKVLDIEWTKEVEKSWIEQHSKARQLCMRLSNYAQQEMTDPLTPDEHLDRAQLSARFHSPAIAVGLLQQFLQQYPSSIRGLLLMGHLQLEIGDEAGVETLDRALRMNPEERPDICERIAAFYRARGKHARASEYERRAHLTYRHEELAQMERSTLDRGDQFLNHGLAAERLAVLRQQLSRCPEIEAAYLLCKEVRHTQGEPLYVLAIDTRSNWRRLQAEIDFTELSDDIVKHVELPGNTSIVFLSGRYTWLRKIVSSMSNARIYRISER